MKYINNCRAPTRFKTYTLGCVKIEFIPCWICTFVYFFSHRKSWSDQNSWKLCGVYNSSSAPKSWESLSLSFSSQIWDFGLGSSDSSLARATTLGKGSDRTQWRQLLARGFKGAKPPCDISSACKFRASDSRLWSAPDLLSVHEQNGEIHASWESWEVICLNYE